MTCVGASVHALIAVEQVRSLVPYVAHCVDVELVCEVALADLQLARSSVGASDAGVAYAVVVHQVLEVVLVVFRYLDDDAGVLCQQHLDDVVAVEHVEAYVETAVNICKAHLKQRCNHTACADVVSGHYPAVAYQFLKGVEGVAEVFRILHRGHVVAHLAERLCECAAAEAKLVV